MRLANRFLKTFVVTAALAIAPLSAAFAVPTFSFVSPSGALHPSGSRFSVDVVAAGVADLYAWQFSVLFDPSILRVLAVTEGPFLGAGGATFFDGGAIDNATGRIAFTFDTLVSAVPGVSGVGVLARLDLAALASGSASLALTDIAALDSLLNDVTVTAQSITLVVPEPGTLALIAIAGGLFLVRRKRRAGSRPTPAGA